MSGAATERDTVETLRARGFELHERGELAGAARAYRQVLRESPQDMEVKHALGVLSVQTGQYAEAQGLLREVLRERETGPVRGDMGNALLGLSRYDEAIGSFDRALELEPGLVGVHLNRGQALRAVGRWEEALVSYEAAIAGWPQFFEAHIARAELLAERQRGEEALVNYEAAAALRPADAGSQLSCARQLLQLGRWEAALARVERALELGTPGAAVHTMRGLCRAGMERWEAALESYGEAIASDIDYVPAYLNRGVLLRGLKRWDEALQSLGAALEREPGSVDGLSNRAAVLSDMKRYEEALADTQAALALGAERAEVQLNRGAALTGLGRHEEALECYEGLLGRGAEEAEMWVGRAGALQHLHRYEEALRSCDRALERAPRLADAHFNRGAALRDLRRIDEALDSFTTADRLQPRHALTRCSLAHLYLATGRLDLGWECYEWRNELPGSPELRQFAQPRWRGEELAGGTLFIHPEQGLGDAILFCRYAKLAEARGAAVVLSVQNALGGLMRGLSPTIEVLEETAAPPAFDYHCPLGSLPGAFGTTLDTIPGAVPYLTAEQSRVSRWRERLGTQGFKIGICWQGGMSEAAGERSFPLQGLRRISRIPGVRLISLRKGEPGRDAAIAAGMAVETLDEDFDAGPDAFLDTAAVMESLDLVISCDTAIAHLAGALGRPAWVALKYMPDWRWLLDRDDSPWYPTLRLYRQAAPGQWDAVFENIHRDLSELLARTANS